MNRTHFGRLLAVLTLSIGLAVPASILAQAAPEKPKSVAPSDYVIGPEDVLTIITRDMPEASGDYMVRPDGTISYPIAGTVNASGMTPGQLQAKLVEALKVELREPVVTVNVKQMRMNRIYILGIVSRPSLYDYKPGWRLTELIAAAGGLGMMPERLTATIFRVGQPNKTISMRDLFVLGKDDSNIALQPNDVVNIRSEATIRISVVGQVIKPGQYDIPEGQGAAEALAAAGGGRENAALSRAVVQKKEATVPVNLYEVVSKGKPDSNVALSDGDTLYVPELVERVSIVGTVNRPGTVLVPDGRTYTVTQAISDAGGPAQRAKLDGVVVARQGNDGKVEQFQLNYKEITSAKAPDFVLQDRDVIFIPESGKTNAQQAGSIMNLWFLVQRVLGF